MTKPPQDVADGFVGSAPELFATVNQYRLAQLTLPQVKYVAVSTAEAPLLGEDSDEAARSAKADGDARACNVSIKVKISPLVNLNPQNWR
jgi:hypothetical protein